jgi:hypothetical protein
MMSKRILRLLPLVVAASIALVGCVPTCPPISGPITATVSASGDVSSATIPDGAYGYYDAGGGDWCATGDFEADKIDVNAAIAAFGCFYDRSDKTPPCSPYGALAAIDVKPSNVSFPAPPKPSLRYDLDANPPACEQLGITCGWYGIYQLITPIPDPPAKAWRWVGPATETTYSGKAVAEGDINHFSIFALVELPGPRPVAPPLRAGMIVASDFLEDDRGDVLVAFEILEGDLQEVGQTRLFRFSNVDPAFSDPNLPEECLDLGTPAEQLTCLFPIDTEVTVAVGVDGVANQVSIVGVAEGYEARLFADVQIH